eukprot:TRINITY_DN4383_c1_g1_i4.p3 TRINITY_DN4383_c1_g1~~TRINITY_DN4383_c1_g1_i4.p3  ORF type:complete len:112 (-),score=3.65 TRINITY_DN4383_c1_g1_i4:78-413(-)
MSCICLLSGSQGNGNQDIFRYIKIYFCICYDSYICFNITRILREGEQQVIYIFVVWLGLKKEKEKNKYVVIFETIASSVYYNHYIFSKSLDKYSLFVQWLEKQIPRNFVRL